MTRVTVTGVSSGQVSSVCASCGFTRPSAFGNRIAVRIGFGPPEHLVHAVDQPIGDDVLELFGLVVHLVPRVAHDAHEEQLDEPMAAQHERGELLPGGGERHAGIGLVLDEARLGERLDHRRRGAGRDAERRGQLAHRQQPLRRRRGGRAQVDGLEVVLDGARRKHVRTGKCNLTFENQNNIILTNQNFDSQNH